MINKEWAALYDEINACTLCGLSETRGFPVPGEGSPRARVFFVGEGPGAQEDMSGRPFVGRAGRLLDKMLDAIDLKREDVYIGNVVKCRPPGNRNPSPDEMRICRPYLQRQMDLLQPEVVVCLGKFAASCLIHENFAITRERGVWHEMEGRHYIATFHPAALLRDDRLLIDAWRDMKAVEEKLARLEDAHE